VDKSKKNIIPFIVAILLGIVSVITVNKYITAKTVKTTNKKVRILAAQTVIARGKVISLDQITTKVIPMSVVSEVNISVPMDATARDLKELNIKKAMVSGRISTRSIPAGDPILWSDFRKPQITSLASKLPENRRAVTIPVDSISSVGFNIVPGDHVDILATSSRGCGGAATSVLTASPAEIQQMTNLPNAKRIRKAPVAETYILMQNVLVIAVAQNFNTFTNLENRKMTYSDITLQVSIEEAMMLTHARTQVTLSCILRAPGSVDRLPSKKLFPMTCQLLKDGYIAKLDAARAKALSDKIKNSVPLPVAKKSTQTQKKQSSTPLKKE